MENLIERVEKEILKTPTVELRNLLTDVNIALGTMLHLNNGFTTISKEDVIYMKARLHEADEMGRTEIKGRKIPHIPKNERFKGK